MIDNDIAITEEAASKPMSGCKSKQNRIPKSENNGKVLDPSTGPRTNVGLIDDAIASTGGRAAPKQTYGPSGKSNHGNPHKKLFKDEVKYSKNLNLISIYGILT